MKTYDLAYILTRVLSIYVLIEAMLHLSRTTSFYLIPIVIDRSDLNNDHLHIINIILNLAPFFFLIIISILLWFFSDKIARHIIPKNSNDLGHEINGRILINTDLQNIAFSVVGLTIIAVTIPQVLLIIPNIITLHDLGIELAMPKLKMETVFLLAEKVIRLIIGFLLFFGSKGLTRMLAKIREGDLRKYE